MTRISKANIKSVCYFSNFSTWMKILKTKTYIKWLLLRKIKIQWKTLTYEFSAGFINLSDTTFQNRVLLEQKMTKAKKGTLSWNLVTKLNNPSKIHTKYI